MKSGLLRKFIPLFQASSASQLASWGIVLSLAKVPKRLPKSNRTAPIPAAQTQNALAAMLENH